MKKLFILLTLAVFALAGCTSLGGLDISDTAGPPGAPPVGPGTDLVVRSLSVGTPNTTEGTEVKGWEGQIENDASEDLVGASLTHKFVDETDGTEDDFPAISAMVDGTFGGMYHVTINKSVADDGTITFPTGYMGHGWIMAGDNEEFILFRFTSAGAVTLLTDVSANTANTDSDTDLCVYDGGSGIIIKNRLGASKVLRGVIICDD